METFTTIMMHWGLGLLGVALYVLRFLHSKILSKGFSLPKYIARHKSFWVVTVLLHLVIAVLVAVEPTAQSLINDLGFAVETHRMGWVLLGINLAAVSNKQIESKTGTSVSQMTVGDGESVG